MRIIRPRMSLILVIGLVSACDGCTEPNEGAEIDALDYLADATCHNDEPCSLGSPGSPGSPRSPDGGEDGGPRVAECYTNDDCFDAIARCENGRCVTFDICADDDECLEGTYCHRGQCRAFCADVLDCRGEQSCQAGRCVDVEEDFACRSTDNCEPCESCIFGVCTLSEYFCRADDDCGYDKLCRNGFCTYECRLGEECPRGQSCIEGTCLDDPPLQLECTFNSECEVSDVCINARCSIACETHAECDERQMCDHGICQPDRRPGAQCLRNDHCGDERAECVNGHCALSCWQDGECATGACDLGFCTR